MHINAHTHIRFWSAVFLLQSSYHPPLGRRWPGSVGHRKLCRRLSSGSCGHRARQSRFDLIAVSCEDGIVGVSHEDFDEIQSIWASVAWLAFPGPEQVKNVNPRMSIFHRILRLWFNGPANLIAEHHPIRHVGSKICTAHYIHKVRNIHASYAHHIENHVDSRTRLNNRKEQLTYVLQK